ncbi:MAG: hypothetical protein KGL39_19700 [Patescibacteria group bacterium]|nr:hypothetical protein [Patescibacteria group bacterium]
MIPSQPQLEAILITNSSWDQGCPSIPGKSYEDCLAHWKVQKIITLRKIKKDLDILEACEREQTGDNALTTEVMAIVSRELAIAKWDAKCGTFPIWNSILSKAKGLAEKNLTGKSTLETISEGLFNGKAKSGAGTASLHKDSSARPRSRASSSRSHDSKQGSC